ncbi:acetolactate synthase small subunit [Buchnera aphidicola]|uniref:Acetolactate synthase small subunit n=1 Tax=Buchnera aphidicola (Anoecia oenotherae) TaxID=1241833 RepID=A0A4D6XRA9_9GAMM|nr:acetolactate synthase small subunit [Buchnera aphidicola]QCI19306.1 acetolactate synthase small subunit [Buchnera aphidicola (Anoecia oenotherae)]
MKRTLSLILENEPGSLSRVVGLFSQRGYNIDSINVSTTNDITLSNVFIQTRGDENTIKQIQKQLKKLINIISVIEISENAHISRQISLIKVKIIDSRNEEIKKNCKIFKAEIIYVSHSYYIIQITGTPEKIKSFISKIEIISKILEICTSGIIGINNK